MNIDAIQKTLNDAVDSGAVPGVAAAVTGPEGTIFQGAAGTTKLGGGPPINEHTVFWIASMTKPVTSVAAMQLVERGKLELDAPIGALLPELAHPNILENGQLRPASKTITLKHLLTHTAGFSYPFSSAALADFMKTQKNVPEPGTSASLNAPLLFEPGTRMEYGISTDWLGLAVEAASGERLDAYFLKHIFAPLGMVDTGFAPDTGQQARQAVAHQRAADGALIPGARLPIRPGAEVLSGGGGLFSTVADYQKFMRLFLNQGAGILRPESVAAMTRNQIGDLRAWHFPPGNSPNWLANDPAPGMEAKWGLGFLIFTQKGLFGRNAGSFSWSGMPNTYFWIDPVVNRAAVILMQILPSGDTGAIKTLSAFEAAIYAAPR